MILFNAIIKRNDFYIATPIDDYVLTLTNIDIVSVIQSSSKKYTIIVNHILIIVKHNCNLSFETKLVGGH